MAERPKLSDSNIAELIAHKSERDHRKWLWKIIQRTAMWIVAVAAGGQTLLTFIEKTLPWISRK